MIAMLAAAAAHCGDLSTPRNWVYQGRQYPHVAEALILRRIGTQWSALVAGHPIAVRRMGSDLSSQSQTGSRFTGRIEARSVVGFWIEPATRLDQARAFKVRLANTDPGVWRGTIGGAEDRLTIRLWYLPSPTGAQVLVRNPDGLAGDFRFAAAATGCAVSLKDLSNPDHRAQLRITGPQTAVLTGLSTNLPSLSLRAQPPRERTVTKVDSDWPVAPPEDVGMDSKQLRALVTAVTAFDPRERGVPLIHSFLVARHGKLVAENYFDGYTQDELHELRSTSKSFASLLVGAARTHDIDIGSSSPIAPHLSAYTAPFAADPAKSAITLGSLLAMRSGLACDDFDDSSPGGEDKMQQQASEPDWYRYFLRLPRVYAAGTHYAYCSGGTHVAAGVVAGATHQSALALFDSWLARPLGITEYSNPLDPEGRAYFGGGMHLRPRDLLKFGQLVLNHGRWKGHEIVDPAWLEESTRCPATEADCSEGLGWHFNQISANGRKYREIEGNGNGGQLLMIFPELDMTVVFTAANFNSYPVWRKFRDELTPQYILSAVRD